MNGMLPFPPLFIPVHWEFKTWRNYYTTSVVYLLTSHEYSRTPHYTLFFPCPPCWRWTRLSYIPHSHRTAIQWTVERLSWPCWPISRADQRHPASDHLLPPNLVLAGLLLPEHFMISFLTTTLLLLDACPSFLPLISMQLLHKLRLARPPMLYRPWSISTPLSHT